MAPLIVVLDIDDSSLELPGRNLAVEENIRLTVRPMLKLRKEEERHDPAYHCGATPNITALPREVPSSRIEQPGCQVDHGDLSNVVCRSADSCTQCTKADRRGLGDDSVRDRSQSAGED